MERRLWRRKERPCGIRLGYTIRTRFLQALRRSLWFQGQDVALHRMVRLLHEGKGVSGKRYDEDEIFHLLQITSLLHDVAQDPHLGTLQLFRSMQSSPRQTSSS